MNTRIRTAAFLLVAVTCLSACSGNSDPRAVAGKFWDALLAGDIETVKALATQESRDSITVSAHDKRDHVELSEPFVSETRARVPTLVHTFKNGQQTTLTIETILVASTNGWKVDYNATRLAMMGGSFGQMIKGLSDAMEAGIRAFGDNLEQNKDATPPPAQAPPGPTGI